MTTAVDADAQRFVIGLFFLALVPLAYIGMGRGWGRRRKKLVAAPLTPVPAGAPAPGQVLFEGRGRYVGSTVAGEWLDRTVTGGLGGRSEGDLMVRPEGVQVVPDDGDGFLVPLSSVYTVDRAAGLGGEVEQPAGVVVVVWRHGDLDLESGFRLAEHQRHDELLTVLQSAIDSDTFPRERGA